VPAWLAARTGGFCPDLDAVCSARIGLESGIAAGRLALTKPAGSALQDFLGLWSSMPNGLTGSLASAGTAAPPVAAAPGTDLADRPAGEFCPTLSD